MIKRGQQFKINSVEELKEAYKYLDFDSLSSIEIQYFDRYKFRYIQKTKESGHIILWHYEADYEEIPNPFKQPQLTGIDKAMELLSEEAQKLGFAVEVVFKNLNK